MPLGKNYEGQDCPLARALEIVGQRWTLLVLRDCFYGVRRFGDLLAHLDVPRAVLTERLDTLVRAGLLERRRCGGQQEYLPTERALDLWPAMFALGRWGERHCPASAGPRRVFSHAGCGTDIDPSGSCPACRLVPGPADLVVRPGPGADPTRRSDRVSVALRRPHRMLTPLPTNPSGHAPHQP